MARAKAGAKAGAMVMIAGRSARSAPWPGRLRAASQVRASRGRDPARSAHPELAGYAPKPSYRPLTKFENRGLKLGHGVWDLVCARR